MSDVPTVSCPAISAFDAASPVFVSVFPEPALNPAGVTVALFVPSFTVRPESVRADAPVEKDSDVTPVPVTVVFEVSFPTVTEVAAATVV